MNNIRLIIFFLVVFIFSGLDTNASTTVWVKNFDYSVVTEADISAYTPWKQWRTEKVVEVKCNGSFGERTTTIFTGDGRFRTAIVEILRYQVEAWDTYRLVGGEKIFAHVFNRDGGIEVADTNSLPSGGVITLPRPLIVGTVVKDVFQNTRETTKCSFELAIRNDSDRGVRQFFICRDQDDKEFDFFIDLDPEEIRIYKPTLKDASWGAGYKVEWFQIRNLTTGRIPLDLMETSSISVEHNENKL